MSRPSKTYDRRQSSLNWVFALKINSYRYFFCESKMKLYCEQYSISTIFTIIWINNAIVSNISAISVTVHTSLSMSHIGLWDCRCSISLFNLNFSFCWFSLLNQAIKIIWTLVISFEYWLLRRCLPLIKGISDDFL